MLIRVFKVERHDAAGVLVPIRQCLRARGCMLDFVRSQPPISAIHVRNNDGDMLKPSIIASGIHWHRPALRREIFRELDGFLSELHPNDSSTKAKETLQSFVIRTGYFGIGYFLEGQNL